MTETQECQPRDHKKQVLRMDDKWAALIRRLYALKHGRYMLTITKTNTIEDLTVLELGEVEIK
jgi:hypothetical protein